MKIDKTKKKLIVIILFVLALLGGYLYYRSKHNFVNYEKLERKLPSNYKEAQAKITKIQEIKRSGFNLRGKKYHEGYIYTYVFSVKHKKYMGVCVLKNKVKDVNQNIDIVYLPENPTVNDCKSNLNDLIERNNK